MASYKKASLFVKGGKGHMTTWPLEKLCSNSENPIVVHLHNIVLKPGAVWDKYVDVIIRQIQSFIAKNL